MIENPVFIKAVVAQGIVKREDMFGLELKHHGDAYAIMRALLRKGAAKRELLGKMWGDSLGISYVDLKKTLFDNKVVRLMTEEYASEHKVIPLYQFGEAVTIATANPKNQNIIAQTSTLIGRPVSPVFAFEEEIDDAIEIQYRSSDSLVKFSSNVLLDRLSDERSGDITLEELKKIAGDQVVVDFTREILLLGLKERASDIHIEPEEEAFRIRFRIDGSLIEKLRLGKPLLYPLISRLKIMADLDITERRKPQDGRIQLELSNRSIDFRFSSVPTIYGEKIVMRILGQLDSDEVPSLTDLNFSKVMFDKVKKIIDMPNGIFFVTGPTGSGKSTTLYAALKEINNPDINITTIEDPVEYRLAGVNQVQAHHVIGLNFSMALRAFMRQDPDVILVGEIRDLETAKIASEAALTGHLVLATLHTNDSIQAVTRLIEIGVEPYIVAPSIIGVLAQRLVRKICAKCKEPYQLSPDEITELFDWDGETDVTFYRGAGCDQCNFTGYAGRIGVHEIFTVNDELRSLIARNVPVTELKKCARKNGMQTLRYDGLKKVLRGLTTLDEIDKIAVEDDDIEE